MASVWMVVRDSSSKRPRSETDSPRRGWWRTSALGEDALERFGENGALRGLTLTDVLREYRLSADHNRTAGPGSRLERSALVGQGWLRTATRGSGAGECTDPGTGLATVGYLRARVAEAYRWCGATGRDPGREFVLIVIAAPSEVTAPDPDMVAGVAARALPLLSHGETAARCGPSAVVILRRRDHDTAELLRAARAALATVSVPGWRIWTERLHPNRHFFAAQLQEIQIVAQGLGPTTAGGIPDGRVSRRSRLPGDRAADGELAGFGAGTAALISAARSGHADLGRILHDFARDRYAAAATFAEVVDELRTVRELLPVDAAARFDSASTLEAIAGEWEREPQRLELSAAVDPLLGLATAQYFERRCDELRAEHRGSGRLRTIEIQIDPVGAVDEFGVLMRFGSALQRIFRFGETVARLDGQLIVVAVPAHHDEQRARLDGLVQHPWACGIVAAVRDGTIDDRRALDSQPRGRNYGA